MPYKVFNNQKEVLKLEVERNRVKLKVVECHSNRDIEALKVEYAGTEVDKSEDNKVLELLNRYFNEEWIDKIHTWIGKHLK